ncbi:tRNA methyltransferase, has a role in tRNA modification [Coemansia sp. RSA 2322]|nr:tRNA methyltransferase, has a role in tRNA modification [Coemansia sp. RSA 2322]
MKEPLADTLELSEADKEEQYVHAVYNEIATHFSDTRFKPWPVIERYLRALPIGSLGADVGCGNGKYLGVRTGDIFMMGTDRSESLVDICQQRSYECLVSDGLDLPYREGAFDFAISIAVIHHFSSEERRRAAIKELLRIIRPGGTVLVFVWALEQNGRRKFSESTQDVLVPWVIPAGSKNQPTGEDRIYHRYYHLFREGELPALFEQVGGCAIEEVGYDRDNCTLHHGARQSQGDFGAIAAAVDDLVGLVQPERLLFLAVDGVPPRMKERLQRERRERLAAGPLTPQSTFNSYCITPGTSWMRRVEAYLCEFIEMKRSSDDNWKNLRVVFSGCQDPGEGEQKIMEYLRVQGSGAGRHCIWSNDADSVLLSLTTRVANITMVSERPHGGLSSYTVFDIDMLRDQLIGRYSSPSEALGGVASSQDQVVDDLVFMTLFAGNDFLPPFSFIAEWQSDPGFIDNIWAMYAKLPAEHRRLHDKGRINLRAFCELLRVFAAEGEERLFRKHIGVLALGSQLIALRARRIEWEIQRSAIKGSGDKEDSGEVASAQDRNGDAAHGAKKRKGRGNQNRGSVPYVWSGPVAALTGITDTCDVSRVAGSAPLSAEAKLEFQGPGQSSSALLLALDGQPLVSPTLVPILKVMEELAKSGGLESGTEVVEVRGVISSNKLKWVQSLGKTLHLDCTVRSSTDVKFESECKKWRRRRQQQQNGGARREDGATIVIGDIDVCPPTYIISARARALAPVVSGLSGKMAVVSEDDWEVLHADARTERRRDSELAEWRQGFYRGSYGEKSAQFVSRLCECYVNALGWTTQYYFTGEVSSWDFAWPDDMAARQGRVAPLASDLLEYLEAGSQQWVRLPESEMLPPMAREHMLSVMPRDSWALLLSEEEQELAHLLHDSKYSEQTREQVRRQLSRDVSAGNVPSVRVWI